MNNNNIVVAELKQIPLEEQPIEICERKGVGHPDYICDAIANEISIALSKEYLKKFGAIMHHNIDKGLLVAGEVERRFGGGKVLKPMLMVFGDRATFKVDEEEIPVNEIVVETAKEWFRKNLRFVNPEEHVRYQVELKRGSEALRDIFKRGGKVLGANDTSAAVGFFPMTETEKIVLETEKFLNSKDFKKKHPESGEDIKIMGLRKNRELQLTIAMAFVDKFIESEDDYFKKKEEILEEIKEFVNSKTNMNASINLNTLDRRGRGMGGMYLTVLGTSADDGDCGQVGRGNRVNGIIPLNRPTSSEAAAGKNPVSHIGKIYNILSYKMAEKIYQEIPGIKEVYVWLLSEIGQPIDQPKIASAQLILEPNTNFLSISKQVKEIIQDELSRIDRFCESLVKGKYEIC
ncbi:MAG: methionine adenosyltransferase [Candidatus Bathyarchaeia archaeon]|nr:methionine adenosyltransferase [Candidatus Bathyarchaeota archaeon]